MDIIELIRGEAGRSGFEVRCEFAPERPADVSANVLDASALQRISDWRPRIGCAEGIREVWQAQLAALPG
jgi:nucleoside-diphosphate-sugar epimerase